MDQSTNNEISLAKDIEWLKDFNDKHESRINDHGDRIRDLEKFMEARRAVEGYQKHIESFIIGAIVGLSAYLLPSLQNIIRTFFTLSK